MGDTASMCRTPVNPGISSYKFVRRLGLSGPQVKIVIQSAFGVREKDNDSGLMQVTKGGRQNRLERTTASIAKMPPDV